MNLEPIRALLKLAEDEKEMIAEDDKYGTALTDRLLGGAIEKFNEAAWAAVPALSQLLEAVTNLEKLEAEWRIRENPIAATIVDQVKASCANDLKRLLHPEDK